MWSVSADPLRFEEAIAWFQGRVPLLKAEWSQLTEEARRRAFTAAGVALLDRMAELHASLLRALEEGTPLDEWRREALGILGQGWNRGHLETIFRNNIQAAYSAGRWDQLQDPAVRRSHPYLMYDAVLDDRTTEICRARDGVVRPADDPWWQDNWPPLHHNCRSGVRALTAAEAQRRGISPNPPSIPPQEGFGLSPAAEEWVDGYAKGQRQAAALPWNPAFAGEPPDWRSYGRPERLPPEPPPRKPLPTAAEVGEERFLSLLAEALGALPAHLVDPTGLAVLVDRGLLDHLARDGRERYLAWLPDLVERPAEVWLVPMQHGRRVVFRHHYLKVYRLGRDRHVLFVAEFHRGVLVGLTFLEAQRWQYAQGKRVGFLRWPK